MAGVKAGVGVEGADVAAGDAGKVTDVPGSDGCDGGSGGGWGAEGGGAGARSGGAKS